MSEVLRAILDHNCTDSRPAFYSMSFTTVGAGGGLTFAQREMRMQCKSDTWFLCMGVSYDGSFFVNGAATFGWRPRDFFSTFELVRGSTGETFSFAPTQEILMNYNLNNFVTLPEYIPFAPAELIKATGNWPIDSATAGNNLTTFLTLMGVEYQFPGGKGVYDYA
jgi:hypothetical protein